MWLDIVDERGGAVMTEHLAAVPTRRSDVLELATHFSRMEGLETSTEFKSDAQAYVDGTIDLDELGRRTRARYGLGMTIGLGERG